MVLSYTFPFGQHVKVLAQEDRTPKCAFVLGVYASAVHARWINSDGKTKVRALAVASEPRIFWTGDIAETISVIERIAIPKELGQLEPAGEQFNGPSGKTLDERFLKPLGLSRENTWLCDLVPHSCVNPSQRDAIKRAYTQVAQKHRLEDATIPPVPNVLADEKRRKEIFLEIVESNADFLILLGDQPLKWFLSHIDTPNHRKRLVDFGNEANTYGTFHRMQIGNKQVNVLPLAHPRQVAKLGKSSDKWYRLHENWIKAQAPKLVKDIKGQCDSTRE